MDMGTPPADRLIVRSHRTLPQCPMEVASWSLADDVTNLTFFDDPTDPDKLALGDRGCAEVSVQSAATAMSYQEYELIDKVECVRYTRTYPCCPNAPWTQLWIIVGVKRRSQFYGRVSRRSFSRHY